MNVDFSKLTTHLDELKVLVQTSVDGTATLKGQVADLQAQLAAAGTTDPAIQAQVDAIDQTVQTMEQSLSPAPAATPAP